MDGPQDRRRQTGRGYAPCPPGPAGEAGGESRAPPRARAVDAELPPGRVVRRRGTVGRRAARTVTAWGAQNERQPGVQRRSATARSVVAGLSGLRSEGR